MYTQYLESWAVAQTQTETRRQVPFTLWVASSLFILIIMNLMPELYGCSLSSVLMLELYTDCPLIL